MWGGSLGRRSSLVVLPAQAIALHRRWLQLRPNNSFIQAEPASLLGSIVSLVHCSNSPISTLRVGLIQALGRTERVQRFGGFGVVVAPLLRRVFGSRRWLGDRASGSSHAVASGLRFGVRVPTLQCRDCSLLVGSSGRRYGYRGAAGASLAVRLASASAAP